MNETFTPVYILSGFLGSGKTTLLKRLLSHLKDRNLRPAVVMNELGEVNLDGLLVDAEISVPMAELLGGCICCTSRGDLATELATLIKQEHPDVVIVETTGAANPLQVVDEVTETSLYLNIELKGLITVVDAFQLLDHYRSQQGKTYRLMQEQVRCAGTIVLNKLDSVSDEEKQEAFQLVRKWNAYAPVFEAVKGVLDAGQLLAGLSNDMQSDFAGDDIHQPDSASVDTETPEGGPVAGTGNPGGRAVPNEAHDHVTAYTHYFSNPVDSHAFEAMVRSLPRDVYRAKGIVSFSDAASRFLFQYAYREVDFMKITPQGDVKDVAVFIGEQFSRKELRSRLLELEGLKPQLPRTVKRSF